MCVGGQCSLFTDEKTEALVEKGCWGTGAHRPGLCSAYSLELDPPTGAEQPHARKTSRKLRPPVAWELTPDFLLLSQSKGC